MAGCDGMQIDTPGDVMQQEIGQSRNGLMTTTEAPCPRPRVNIQTHRRKLNSSQSPGKRSWAYHLELRMMKCAGRSGVAWSLSTLTKVDLLLSFSSSSRLLPPPVLPSIVNELMQPRYLRQ